MSEFLSRGFGGRRRAPEELAERLPPGISLIRFKPHIPRHFRKRADKRRAYMRTPPSCPATGAWTTTVLFSYRDGSTQQLAAATPCRR